MTGKTRFEKLLEPGYIGSVKTRNRMIKTAAGTSCSDPNGYVNDRHKVFYEAEAKGGVGLIIVEATPVDYPLGIHRWDTLRIDDDQFILSMSELTKLSHKHGCPMFLQLMHAGPWHTSIRCPEDTKGWKIPQVQPVAASIITDNLLKPEFDDMRGIANAMDLPRELTIDEIQGIVEKFATAAVRAQKAGFDGVEVNASTSHLLNTFLSRIWNKRQDAYGCGSLENRARFVVEIIRETKRLVGKDYPVGIIFNGAEFGSKEGTTIEETKKFSQMWEDAGVDFIHVRAHSYGLNFPNLLTCEWLFYPERMKPWPKGLDKRYHGRGALVPLAAEIKKVVSVPVITVGRLDPVLGEKILEEGKADFIGFSRRLMSDPELPSKVAAGRLEDIAPCTACQRCSKPFRTDLSAGILEPVRCRVNAALGGVPEDYVIKQAERKKTVLVVGGGPGGMEAARVAAIRGHKVILYEKEPKLGGRLPLAALVKGLEIEDLVALQLYLETQVKKLGVKIRLGKEVNLSVIDEIKPDVIILAAGSVPAIPEIPGINLHNVVTGPDLHNRVKFYLRLLGPKTLRWLTRFWMPLGRRVVIIGGEMEGCELAEFLVKRGRNVTIVDTAERMGEGLEESINLVLFRWLAQKGVTMMAGVKYEEITDKGLIISTKEGKRQVIEADTIVTAIPYRPNTELSKIMEGKAHEIYSIGDCYGHRHIIDAITDGYRVARAI